MLVPHLSLLPGEEWAGVVDRMRAVSHHISRLVNYTASSWHDLLIPMLRHSMDTERDLLFGVIAFQNGAVDADCLAETCTAWATKPSASLADHFVDRGLITVEQRSEVERTVAQELEAHDGDPHATLAATLDQRSLTAMGELASSKIAVDLKLNPPAHQAESGHVRLGAIPVQEADSRDRYTLTHLHAKGGMGRVWLARDTALGRQIAPERAAPRSDG